ncbi:MAG: RIP metalloprotease RseP [Acidiferrobacterales bacterium]
MISGIYMLVAFVVALGILIVVHEFGHYWVAKRVGVKVLRFSVGFGKPIWSRRWGKDQTEFVVSAIPLGGYVRMLGEDDDDFSPDEAHRAFSQKSLPKRVAVVVAGPLFNLAFAVFAFWLVYMIGIEGIRPVVGKVAPQSIAEAAGFSSGDELLELDGKPVQTWGQHRMYIFRRALDRAELTFTVRTASGKELRRYIDLSRIPIKDIDAGLISRGIGLYVYMPELPAIFGQIETGPAAAAGLEPGDLVIEVERESVSNWSEFASRIRARPGRPTRLVVKRGTQELTITVTPEERKIEDKTIGLIGVRPEFPGLPDELKAVVRFGPLKSLSVAAQQTWTLSVLTLEMLYRMLKLEISSRNISGPLTIAQAAGYSAQLGIDRFLMFLALVSISLGVLNLLPIPVLDGGHLLYYAFEAVRGKPLSEEIQAWGQQIGIILLVGLMVLAFYNDITRILFE